VYVIEADDQNHSNDETEKGNLWGKRVRQAPAQGKVGIAQTCDFLQHQVEPF
jgi:hypothetical protein